jgi:hypothetical protein
MRSSLLMLLGIGAAACRRADDAPPLFERLAPAVTGVTFENRLPVDSALNILNFLYYYNGGGVAAGDVNGDGLPDLYFTSNLGSDRLYLNRGDYRFEDVTARAGVGGPTGWKTGVTMADVDGDGKLDIYVSTVSYRGLAGKNALYINNGDGTFTDRAHEYGLDHQGYGTQAAFFDYDGDGDLDLFVLSFSTHDEQASDAPKRDVRAASGGGRLYRNDGGHFHDVSAAAGIYGGSEGFGLGLVVSDLDLDGCPDVYVANDFQENDFLYHNDCDGTFTESIARATGHTSRFAMGVDAADVNNDGRPDIMVVDMLPDQDSILKSSASTEDYRLSELRTRAGYHPQYVRNTLQLNRGDGRFSEIAPLAGVQATDWSWAPLLADLDDDGRKDLFVTSGIVRRPNDLDYIELVGQPSVQATLRDTITKANLALLDRMPRRAAPNRAFRNLGGLRFADVTKAWGLGQPGFSNGAAYVDLANRGALDLVVNTIDAPAAIYRNRGRVQTGHSSLTVALRGTGRNTLGIGAKLFVWSRGGMQYVEQSPTRGFQSSVDQRLHVGLGPDSVVDSLLVVWPDRSMQRLKHLPANHLLTLAQGAASGRWTPPPSPAPLFRDVTDAHHLDARHVENDFVDFDREPLMPRLLSTEGPALAVADVDGDGRDDVFLGGATFQAGALLLQQSDGSFRRTAQPALAADSIAEDVDATFLDANGDGHPDLYVVSAGNQFELPAAPMRGRLYLNDGHGLLTRATDAIPALYDNGGCVAAGDFDGDGHVDLFVGSRSVPGRYGVSPKSHLLRNDGTGRFSDVTVERAPALSEAGMVTSCAWVDYDGDGHLDLVVVGEWMPVRVFHNEGGKLVERTAQVGLAASAGWWNTVSVADVNADGHPDLVLGNLGLNSTITASKDKPAKLYVGRFAGDSTVMAIPTAAHEDGDHVIAGRDELLRALPALRERFPSYASFGSGAIDKVLSRDQLRGASTLQATTLASSIARNDGKGHFVLEPLPVEAQLAPVNAVIAADFDRDGHVDLLLGGNFFGVPPAQGRYDASRGVMLRGDGHGKFVSMDAPHSGLDIDGQVRRMREVRTPGGPLVAVARNNDRLLVLQVAPISPASASASALSSKAP